MSAAYTKHVFCRVKQAHQLLGEVMLGDLQITLSEQEASCLQLVRESLAWCLKKPLDGSPSVGFGKRLDDLEGLQMDRDFDF